MSGSSAPTTVNTLPPNATDYSHANTAVANCITVFGSSKTEEGSQVWNNAFLIGKLAADRGMSVASGGYSGTMMAVSQGAAVSDTASALTKSAQSASPLPPTCSPKPIISPAHTPQIHGILLPGSFPGSDHGNKFLTRSVDAEHVADRTHTLTTISRYFIAFSGGVSTLMEFTTIWALWYMTPVQHRPILIAFRDPWEGVIQGLVAGLDLPDRHHVGAVHLVDSAEEAFQIIDSDRKQAVEQQKQVVSLSAVHSAAEVYTTHE